MRMNEVTYDDSRPVDAYGPGFFRIGGEIVQGAVIILPSGVFGWGGQDDRARLLAAAGEIDVLFIGTGAEIAQIPRDLRAVLEGAGLGVEIAASPAACRTYNVLLSEGRRVGLAALPV
ncbi:Mth938-like domain-containing protein [Roseicyclus mahoneyensis]|uniref:Mth938-like domain-containing protein n=1 Tax=Roseicyclus mahoneyensis TaxID=164332 RepID=A0A316GM57_9RHOB|nr:Mth938-like domain-containing protein [Roseicyclus mahoneyensis]PWK61009.1 uncharacterized protein C7455_103209 [Roseicyclus mahoneyensis]